MARIRIQVTFPAGVSLDQKALGKLHQELFDACVPFGAQGSSGGGSYGTAGTTSAVDMTANLGRDVAAAGPAKLVREQLKTFVLPLGATLKVSSMK